MTRQLGIQPRPFEEARLKGIHEKLRKYERKPFDGTDEDRAYLLGLRHGDLSVSRPFGDAIRVSTSTTHPQMAELFWRQFRQYGHIYLGPRYKEDTRSYEWNLYVIIDASFGFLLQDRPSCWDWVSQTEGRLLAYLAGIVDAEGHISITPDKGNTSLMVTVYNTSRELLEFTGKSFSALGYKPVGPYLDKEKGTISSKYGIMRKKDYFKVVLARFDESQALLRRLPFRHPEKIQRKDLAVSLSYREPWMNVRQRIRYIQVSVRAERDEFVRLAQVEYERRHPQDAENRL